MAETCAWPDCRSSEVQAHNVTRQCLTCGRHSDMEGNSVVWVRDRVKERGEWLKVRDINALNARES